MTFTPKQRYFMRTNMVTYAPAMFFIAILIGVVLHINFPVLFVSEITGWIVGGILLLFSPVLSFWAMRIRRNLYIPVIERTCTNFYIGPYKFSRHPMYVGFLLMVVGFAFVINSFVMILLAIGLLSFFTGFVIPEEEKELSKQCPEVYTDYKKKVRMWI